MKMGTIASQWRYDAAGDEAPQQYSLRRATISHYASRQAPSPRLDRRQRRNDRGPARNAQGSPLDYIRHGYMLARMRKSVPQAPLTPAVFHILLALVGQERHGYDIMQQVKSDSQGAVKMGPGTLYGSLDRMIEAGLVTKGNTRDPRRIYYKLTMLGLATLRAETERLSRLAVVARRQLGTA
jgi:DNA-binding MarR family transcriptional regulator